MNKTTQITIETHSITIIRTSGKQNSAHCEHCLKTVAAFTPEQIAAFLQLDLTEIRRRAEVGEIHLTQNGRNAALICGASLEDRGI